MKGYLALIALDLKLVLRQRSVLLFNYLFPLIFFLIYGQLLHGARGAGMGQIVTLVLIIGVLGNGLFGAGIRAVQEREANILRRYKVAPITPAPLLIASTVTGWVLFMPLVVVVFLLAHLAYGMEWPANFASILIFATLGILAFRAIGMVLAAVANSMQESQIMVQLLYLPMLLLSGATFPAWMFPAWLFAATQFLPATHLVTGLQGMLLRHEGLLANGPAVLAMLITIAAGLFVAFHLFRWEKEEKIKTSAKLWIGAVMFPFLLLGAWQVHTKQNAARTRIIDRQMARNETFLVRNARIFIGDGHVIEAGAILVRNGKISEVYKGAGPGPADVHATLIEAAGTTLLPGLIDVNVHLAAPGGIYANPDEYQADHVMRRALAAYLYSGVTTVRNVGGPVDLVLHARSEVNSGEFLGAELFTCGPVVGPTGPISSAEASPVVQQKRVPLAGPVSEIRDQVDTLKNSGVDCVTVALTREASTSASKNRSSASPADGPFLSAAIVEAHAHGLPVTVTAATPEQVEMAVAAGADSITYSRAREQFSGLVLEKMAAQGTAYDPALSAVEARGEFMGGRTDLLKRSLAQQVGPAELFEGTIKAMNALSSKDRQRFQPTSDLDLKVAGDGLKSAYGHGVTLVVGSEAGEVLVIHGPSVQREVELWVQAGVPPAVALQAATLNAARLLHIDDKIGTIRKGNDADLILVDGDPLQDITAIERIEMVMFKGERIEREDLFNQH